MVLHSIGLYDRIGYTILLSSTPWFKTKYIFFDCENNVVQSSKIDYYSSLIFEQDKNDKKTYVCIRAENEMRQDIRNIINVNPAVLYSVETKDGVHYFEERLTASEFAFMTSKDDNASYKVREFFAFERCPKCGEILYIDNGMICCENCWYSKKW